MAYPLRNKPVRTTKGYSRCSGVSNGCRCRNCKNARQGKPPYKSKRDEKKAPVVRFRASGKSMPIRSKKLTSKSKVAKVWGTIFPKDGDSYRYQYQEMPSGKTIRREFYKDGNKWIPSGMPAWERKTGSKTKWELRG